MRQRQTALRRGQAAAEFALLLPLLALLLAGVIDVGRGFHQRITLTNAVREGARYGASHPTDEVGIKQTVQDELVDTSLSTLADDAIEISTPDGTEAENPIRVYAAADFQPFMGAILGFGSIYIRASATMMIMSGT